MRERSQQSFFSHIVLASLLLFASVSQAATEQDEFDGLACVKYVLIVDKLAQLRDGGFPKSTAYRAATDINVGMFTRAIASVFELQKNMSRDELDLYALGWCAGQSEAVIEDEVEADLPPELVSLIPRRQRHPAGPAEPGYWPGI